MRGVAAARRDRDRTRPAIIPAPRRVTTAVRLGPVSHVGDLKAGPVAEKNTYTPAADVFNTLGWDV